MMAVLSWAVAGTVATALFGYQRVSRAVATHSGNFQFLRVPPRSLTTH
jgi:hypothetical protein